MNHVITLALFGALAWGFWAFFADLAMRTMAPEAAMVVSYVAGIAIAGVYILSRGTDVLAASPTALGFAVAAGIASGAGAIAYYAALQAGAAGIATTITAMYFVVAAVLGIAFLGDSLNVTDVAGIGAAVVAVLLLSH